MENKIVILGGSFNPCTIAHQDTLLRAMKLVDAKHGIYLPTGNHYEKEHLLDFHTRVHLLSLMNTCNTSICTYENSLTTHPKTLHSLDYLQTLYPTASLYFMVGLDNLIDLPNWFMPEVLLTKYHFICTSREHQSVKDILDQPFYQPYLSHIHVLQPNPLIQNISSSQVRALLQEKKAPLCAPLLQPDVYQYICEHQLYI